MKQKYVEYTNLDLSKIGKDVLGEWEAKKIFNKSIENRKGCSPYVFYEGPPSANGLPGIHHIIARTIKDIFCRYKTLKGFYVERKGGWDTHGLPIEISVEKALGITKEDIGKKISIIDYNKQCRINVMKYKDLWDDITKKIGYWVNLDNPYITFDNKYIETVWYLLKKLYDKKLLYKGYSVQPYSPAAGTGLSTHELNQPGCYKMVKDNTVVAQFKVVKDKKSEFLFKNIKKDLFFIAWTTTPWTLPSNTALAVGKNIKYVIVETFNKYTFLPITVILAKDLLNKFFPEKNSNLKIQDYKSADRDIPFKITGEYKGSELDGIRYEQLMPYVQPVDGDAFRVVTGDFVTIEEGTGIVHIAPSFGADDFKLAKQNNLGSLTLVNKKGQFVDTMGEFAGRYVKYEFNPDFNPETDTNVDIDIIVKLKKENKTFKIEKYEHSYPHCWRTDKPILYYPLDSWFIKTTAYKEQMLKFNNTINWKPKSTGTGRFGNWLENLVDWNLSRSRFWGTPLPIWTTKNHTEQICIGSVEQLKKEIEKSVKTGFMKTNPLESFVINDFSDENYNKFDMHRPFVDEIILTSEKGKKMFRESDLIDVWFDSGAMPYAQYHYPFENNKEFKNNFPADFIAEGVDQTRGWFFTLHAIATMIFDSVAYKNVVSNGLVLDKKGNKMSKRFGNTVDPFKTIDKYGADATRWYMIANAQPWDNLKFDIQGIVEVQKKFFGTLYNTYSFFALYANIDGFVYKEKEIPIEKRPEIDRWIMSELNTLIKTVDKYYADYEPTKAARYIQKFVCEYLSNWYVRLCRRRFWKGDYSDDKISAYQTLYKCLEVIAQVSSPIAPFFMDKLFCNLNAVTNKKHTQSVHLTDFSLPDEAVIDENLEQRMQLSQKISSMVLKLRKKQGLRVRQPLNTIMIPISDEKLKKQIKSVENIILSEVNVKKINLVTDKNDIWTKKIKPNFKSLGPKYGKQMKKITAAISNFSQDDIKKIEIEDNYLLNIDNQEIKIDLSDVEIVTENIPGWIITNMDNLTVALDINITQELKEQGIARDLVNRIQKLRKDSKFDVTDRIFLQIEKNDKINMSINNNLSYICSETLATSLNLVDKIDFDNKLSVDLADDIKTYIAIEKC